MLVASLIVSLVALATVLPSLFRVAKQPERPVILACLVCTIPMCWLMLHGVRLPCDRFLQSLFSGNDVLFWMRTAYAPLTEEPAKLWPLMIPSFRRSLKTQNLVAFAIALGVGFAVGEVFTVAGLIQVKSPEIANLPWHALGGFISERLMTCLIHSGMTCVALWFLANGRGVIRGLLLAMGMHYVVNLPIALAQFGWFGSNELVSQIILQAWVATWAVVSGVILFQLSGVSRPVGEIVYGEAVCPSCGARYSRSLLKGINLGLSRRYEPCPACNKWHWTNREEPQDA